jgi:hypothetical protein
VGVLKCCGVQGSLRNVTATALACSTASTTATGAAAATAATYTTPATTATGTCYDVAKRIGYLSAQSNTAVP